MELMVYLLRAFGYTPLAAYDGEEGVRMARSELPDLIICDVHLPKLDGYGVVAELKKDPLLRKIPALAVTALAMVGDRERLLEAVSMAISASRSSRTCSWRSWNLFYPGRRRRQLKTT